MLRYKLSFRMTEENVTLVKAGILYLRKENVNKPHSQQWRNSSQWGAKCQHASSIVPERKTGSGRCDPWDHLSGGQRWIVQLHLNLHEPSFDSIHIKIEMAFALLPCSLSNLMMTTLASQIIHSKVFWKLPWIDTKRTPISEMGYYLFK